VAALTTAGTTMVTVTVTTTMRVVGGLLPMLARLFFRFSYRIDEFVSDTTVFNLGLGLSTYRATFDVHFWHFPKLFAILRVSWTYVPRSFRTRRAW